MGADAPSKRRETRACARASAHSDLSAAAARLAAVTSFVSSSRASISFFSRGGGGASSSSPGSAASALAARVCARNADCARGVRRAHAFERELSRVVPLEVALGVRHADLEDAPRHLGVLRDERGDERVGVADGVAVEEVEQKVVRARDPARGARASDEVEEASSSEPRAPSSRTLILGAVVSVWSITIQHAMCVIIAARSSEALRSGVVPPNAPGGTHIFSSPSNSARGVERRERGRGRPTRAERERRPREEEPRDASEDRGEDASIARAEGRRRAVVECDETPSLTRDETHRQQHARRDTMMKASSSARFCTAQLKLSYSLASSARPTRAHR